MRYPVTDETRKGLSKQEKEEFAASLEEKKIYHVNELVDKAAKMYPERSAESMKHTLGSELVNSGLCIRVGYGQYMKNYSQKPLNPPKNPQDSPEFIEVQPPYVLLHVATEGQLAAELRRRGFLVEVSVMEKKKLDI
jgi:hypothetical protein